MELTSQELVYLMESKRRQASYRLIAIQRHNIQVIKHMLKQGYNLKDYPDIYKEYQRLVLECGDVFNLEDDNELGREEIYV